MIAHFLARSDTDPGAPIPRAPGPDPDPIASAKSWHREAPRLAAWADRVLVARRDCYGGYYRDRATGKARQKTRWTVPDPSEPSRSLALALGVGVLEAHFRCLGDLDDKVGLHVADPSGHCRWGVVDIDAHGPGDDPDANLRMAAHVVAALGAMGLSHRLLDSNGAGGYHIWYLFGRRAPMEWAWRLGRLLVEGHAGCGLGQRPESFPKSASLSGKGCSNFVRLMGDHHTREHLTAVWSPAGGRWLRGAEAIGSLLAFDGDPSVDLGPLVPDGYAPAGRAASPASPRVRPSLASEVRAEFSAAVAGESPEVSRARAALCYLTDHAEEYDEWVTIGMALKSLGDEAPGDEAPGDEALDLWDDFSALSGKYPGYDEIARVWGTFRPGLECGGVTMGTLFMLARRAGWDGSFTDAPGPGRRRGSIASRAGGPTLTPAMSEAWDRDQGRYIANRSAAGESPLRLALRLGLSIDAIAPPRCGIEFGLKQTNEIARRDGKKAASRAWTWPERDARGRTTCLVRLFADPEAETPVRPIAGKRERRGAPGLVTRVARRGLLFNLDRPGVPAGPVLVVAGLRDYLALATRGLACVAVPGPGACPRGAMGDLVRLLAAAEAPVIFPYRDGDDPPWDAARPLLEAAAPGRVTVRPYPREFTDLGRWAKAARAVPGPGVLLP